ncbi:hypothetical protein HPP92_003517 [Vanilla planifolia]|uniref:Uncharacterized protein n=1 Tax=Vanilla planifolia TaxID=51239 RepID=A0A835SAI8_VANPL|nr:hypothetical protein HPP92_003922 [Vanilla planifolia]KAG0503445.1 hypothetical protein HPP92_003517 [Vanilla planifolia]
MFELEKCLFLQKKVIPVTLWLESQRMRSKNHILVTHSQQCSGASFSCSITLVPQCQFILRSFATPVSLNQEPFSSPEDDHISYDNVVTGIASEKKLPEKSRTEELKSVLLDSERSKLLKKLSEANQFNRFLKRQLQTKDEFLVNLKNELAVLELEFQMFVNLAEEIASYGMQPVHERSMENISNPILFLIYKL